MRKHEARRLNRLRQAAVEAAKELYEELHEMLGRGAPPEDLARAGEAVKTLEGVGPFEADEGD
jgi:hypothetical protein